eukprot:gnl/MRDRNA2_/MRDRNA2_73756_c0_seq1.p1 gnl/MRDRNA2_/MRDRNA2_73756_c0~~gnl/MRDRNA2_/MRDRNA2_73756_c0_seq1.p1  ORF type:complete len:399 (+),score=31.33 gnl/MRDRNA2_/MRDRNA2_73756_c0_seq1:89-1285(+)
MEAGSHDLSWFSWSKHATYFLKHLEAMPGQYRTMDNNRLTLMYFCVSGLDILGRLGDIDKQRAVNYVYSQQSTLARHGGFYGYPKVSFESEELDQANNQPHIANTYTALAILIILGDDLSRVNRVSLEESLRKWQLPDGSFCCVHGLSKEDSEHDVRFVYCAAVICYVLDLWHAIDVEKMFQFIVRSQSYDSAMGMGPLCESHGGCTYCAVAALSMMGRVHMLPDVDRVIDWCVRRQTQGFQGRIEKPPDSCYSFWVGASLSLLGCACFIDAESCTEFIHKCQSHLGGFQKFPESQFPDLLHSYMSLCGLSYCGKLPAMNAQLGITQRAFSSVAQSVRIAPGGRYWGTEAWLPVPQPQAHGIAVSGKEEGSQNTIWKVALIILVIALLVTLVSKLGVF